MSNRFLTVLLVIVAAVLLIPKLGFRIAPTSVAPPPPPQTPTGVAATGAKARSIIGEITGTVATLIGAGKEIAGLLGRSNKPNDYGQISI